MTVSKIRTEPHAQGEIEVFRLAYAAGAYVDVCNIGAGISAGGVPDRDGRMADVALGYRAQDDAYAREPKVRFPAGEVIDIRA